MKLWWKRKKNKNEKNKEKNKENENKEKKREEFRAPLEKKLLYPLVSSKQDKEREFARFRVVFKKPHIIIPFVEALEEMSMYAKFMKKMLTKKRKILLSSKLVVMQLFKSSCPLRPKILEVLLFQ